MISRTAKYDLTTNNPPPKKNKQKNLGYLNKKYFPLEM